MSTQNITSIAVVIASISPLFTLTYLWQVKEWRIDRLKEHLRSEGYLSQLFGTVRPVIILLGIIATLAGITNEVTGSFLLSCTLAILSIVQIGIGRQPLPVWTHKAKILFATAVCITIGIILYVYMQASLLVITLPLLVVLQPFILAVAWVLWKPVDTLAKKFILSKAEALRAKYNLVVVGITGSVGKTTTKELLAHIVASKNPLVTPAHVNSEMGIAKWLLHALPPIASTEQETESSPRICIVEMGAYRKGEIRLLCKIAKPSLGIVTYIGSQHIALFGSQESLCNAKGELIESLPETGHAFLNMDNTLCGTLASKAKCPITRISTGGSADIEAYNIEETSAGIQLQIEERTIQTHIQGTHNVTNILLAYAAAVHLGLDPETICKQIESFTPPSQTFTLTKQSDCEILDDSHNASQASFEAAIQWASNHAATEKILITPGLIELGEKQDAVHTELGGLSKSVFDRVIFTSHKSAAAFAKGFGADVEFLNKNTKPITKGSLIVCEGRIGKKAMNKMLSLLQ